MNYRIKILTNCALKILVLNANFTVHCSCHRDPLYTEDGKKNILQKTLQTLVSVDVLA